MNYLAHLHIADVTKTSATGNLLGDFVKGRVQNLPYEQAIKDGVRLHRAVDSFTDKHPLVHELKSELGSLRRYGGIILDVLFDHHLALNFEHFHSDSLANFANDIYLRIDGEQPEYPERFQLVCQRMRQMDWLTSYRDIKNIEQALVGISRRLSRPVDLTECLDWHQTVKSEFKTSFLQFYTELLVYSQDFASAN